MDVNKMMTYPNQKKIIVNRITPPDEHTFTIIDHDSQRSMMNDLSKLGSVKLWLYLTKNKDNYVFALSPKACEPWGIRNSEYRAAIKELTEKGYLECKDGNVFNFYEYPNLQNERLGKKRADDLLDDLLNDHASRLPFSCRRSVS